MSAGKKLEAGCILFVSLLFGMAFWLMSGVFEYLFFNHNLSFLLLEGPETLWESIFSKIPPQSLFVRISFILACLSGGVLTAVFVYQKRNSDEALMKAMQEQADLKRQAALSRKIEFMGLLVGGVAHDLNNILSGVVSYPEMLLKDPALNGSHRQLVAATLASGQRAAAVVSDLLTVARGVNSSKTNLDLNALVREFLASPEFGELRKAHPSVAMETDLEDNLARINGSALHILKSLMNLVANAAEAVAADGVVHIRTANEQLVKPWAGYTEIPPGTYATLSVSDTGGGISEADMDKIFEPFYTRKMMGRSGTGLGLVVVWNMVQDHEGYIDVGNGPEGADFRIYFDAVPAQAARSRQRQSAPPQLADYRGNGEKILVIDDEETQRDIACRMLDLLGYQTAAVGSGEEALDYLKSNPADLLVLDMFMKGGMNGAETYEQILDIKPGQKAVIASGFAVDRAVRRTQAAGAGAFLIKPYSMETIGLAIRKELSGN